MLHDDGELAEALGSPLTERATIHEWPLSCVQRVRTAGGGKFIYKVQAPPTLEAGFYARARSPLLVPARLLEGEGETSALILVEVEAPRLADFRPGEAEAAAIAGDLVRQIAEIEGRPPILFDIASEDGWLQHIGAALDDIRVLIAEGGFSRVDSALADRLEEWSEAPSVLDAIRLPAGFVHADLKADNVLVAAQGDYRILDWQRPIRGPVALDTATLLISLGFDPLRLVPAGIVQLYHFLHIAWFAQAARRWYPQGKPWFDGFIQRIAGELEQAMRKG